MLDLISIHIGKTAGTAFLHILRDIYGSDGVLVDYPPDRVYKPESPLSEKVKVIHGHFPAKKYKKYFPEAGRIVWLRHPIFRLISEYFFAKFAQHKKKNSIHAELLEKNLDILDFARIPGTSNRLCNYIDGMNIADFYFVGIQEFYLEDLIDLKKMMKWENIKVSTKNINKFPNYQKQLTSILSDRKLMHELALINDRDMELYQNALNLRAKRRNESKFLQSTLADWSRSEFLLQQAQKEIEDNKIELELCQEWLSKAEQPSKTLEVITFPRREIESLSNFRIEFPQKKDKLSEEIHLPLKGWVIGKNSSAKSLVITYNDKIVRQAEINLPSPGIAKKYQDSPGAKNSRFQTSLSVLGMPIGTELLVQVKLEDFTYVSIGVIKILEFKS